MTDLDNKPIRKASFSIGICDPGGVIPINHWIWYDFDKREPVISRAYPSDHKIPEAFQRQLASKQSMVSPSLGAEIALSSPSFGSAPIQDEVFTHGAILPDDFKLWLSKSIFTAIAKSKKPSNASKSLNCTNQ